MDDALYRAALIVFHRELGLPLIEAGRFASAIVVWSAETPRARAAALEEHGAAIRSSGTGRSEAEALDWQRTGLSQRPIGCGRGEDEWYRPSTGARAMFPAGFDPNLGRSGSIYALRSGHAAYFCPGDTFVEAPNPVFSQPEKGEE